jgi:hypothetical protein
VTGNRHAGFGSGTLEKDRKVPRPRPTSASGPPPGWRRRAGGTAAPMVMGIVVKAAIDDVGRWVDNAFGEESRTRFGRQFPDDVHDDVTELECVFR